MSEFDRSIEQRKQELLAEQREAEQRERDERQRFHEATESLARQLCDYLSTTRFEFQIVETEEPAFENPFCIQIWSSDFGDVIGSVEFEGSYIAFNPAWENEAGDYFTRVGEADPAQFLAMFRNETVDGIARLNIGELD